MDEWETLEFAAQEARRLISELPGYVDLASFSTMAYTDEELEELGESRGTWVGQYSKGSALSNGATILINISKHIAAQDMMDTLLHELGHAIWDLLDEETHQYWNTHPTVVADIEGHSLYSKDSVWGFEELFADNFMFLVSGRSQLMTDEKLFRELSES